MSDERSFSHKLGSVFYDVFKVVAGSMNQNKIEEMNKACNNLASVVQRGAEEKAVEVCNKIQEVTKEAFTRMGRDIENLENRVNELSESLEAIADTNRAFFAALHEVEEAEEAEPETEEPDKND